MIIANAAQIELFTGRRQYEGGVTHDATAAKINLAVLAQSGGKLPCYAARIGKGGAVVWVSVGSSARISRAIATEWLGRYGVTIGQVEAAS